MKTMSIIVVAVAIAFASPAISAEKMGDSRGTATAAPKASSAPAASPANVKRISPAAPTAVAASPAVGRQPAAGAKGTPVSATPMSAAGRNVAPPLQKAPSQSAQGGSGVSAQRGAVKYDRPLFARGTTQAQMMKIVQRSKLDVGRTGGLLGNALEQQYGGQLKQEMAEMARISSMWSTMGGMGAMQGRLVDGGATGSPTSQEWLQGKLGKYGGGQTGGNAGNQNMAGYQRYDGAGTSLWEVGGAGPTFGTGRTETKVEHGRYEGHNTTTTTTREYGEHMFTIHVRDGRVTGGTNSDGTPMRTDGAGGVRVGDAWVTPSSIVTGSQYGTDGLTFDYDDGAQGETKDAYEAGLKSGEGGGVSDFDIVVGTVKETTEGKSDDGGGWKNEDEGYGYYYTAPAGENKKDGGKAAGESENKDQNKDPSDDWYEADPESCEDSDKDGKDDGSAGQQSNQNGSDSADQTDQEKADKEKADKEKADKEKADKEKAEKEKAEKEKAEADKGGSDDGGGGGAAGGDEEGNPREDGGRQRCTPGVDCATVNRMDRRGGNDPLGERSGGGVTTLPARPATNDPLGTLNPGTTRFQQIDRLRPNEPMIPTIPIPGRNGNSPGPSAPGGCPNCR